MAFDIGAVLKDMTATASDMLSTEGPRVKECVKKAIEAEKDALDEIAKARIAGEITVDDMKSQIANEKDALKAALLVCQVKGKLAAQKAVNAAIKVFIDAVKVALKAI